jgi:hypothetical protein
LLKFAAYCAHPLSQVELQQYACAGSPHTSGTQYPLASPEGGIHPVDEPEPALSGPPEHVISCVQVDTASAAVAVGSDVPLGSGVVLHATRPTDTVQTKNTRRLTFAMALSRDDATPTAPRCRALRLPLHGADENAI